MSLSEPFRSPRPCVPQLLAMDARNCCARTRPTAAYDGGCDKTTPARHGCDLDEPAAIFMPAGPMLRGDYKGEFLGSGSDTWKYWDELRAGNITRTTAGRGRRHGALAWSLQDDGNGQHHDQRDRSSGLTLPGAAVYSAADSRHARWPRSRARESWTWCGKT